MTLRSCRAAAAASIAIAGVMAGMAEAPTAFTEQAVTEVPPASAPASNANPLPALPEALAEGSAVADSMRVLRGELEALGHGRATTERDAKLAFRRVAFDLLFHGGSAGPDAQAATVSGLRLVALRGEIDSLLDAAATGSRPEDARAMAAVARFAQLAAHGLPSPPDAARPESALHAALAPLEEAVAHLESRGGTPCSTAWPTAQELGVKDRSPAVGEGAAGGPAAVPEPTDQPSLDRRRIESIPGWVDAIGAARAASRAPFAAAAKQWTAALKDPVRAKGARASMAAFEAELAALRPGPLETGLRRQEQRARDACAGRADDILREVDARRSAWAQAWSDGRGSPAASAAAIRAMRALEGIDAAARAAGDASAERSLAAWGGFAATAEGWRVHPKALRAKSALVAEALASRDDAALGPAVDALERDLPLAELAGTLTRSLGAWLPSRGGLGPRLAAASGGPGTAAWLAARRPELMLISRAAIEESRAAARRDARLGDELRTISGALAWRILADVDPASARLRELRDAERSAAARGAEAVPANGRARPR